MKSATNPLISKRVMSYLISVASFCCVIIIFAPSIRFIPAKDLSPGKASTAASPQPSFDSTTTDSNAESKINDDLEFHAKQGGSSKLDFNRLAMEGMNSLGYAKAASVMSDPNALGPSESFVASENLKASPQVRSNLTEAGKKDTQSSASTLNVISEVRSEDPQKAPSKV